MFNLYKLRTYIDRFYISTHIDVLASFECRNIHTILLSESWLKPCISLYFLLFARVTVLFEFCRVLRSVP